MSNKTGDERSKKQRTIKQTSALKLNITQELSLLQKTQQNYCTIMPKTMSDWGFFKKKKMKNQSEK